MPQPSISYACGRVGVHKRTALKKAQLERLTSAHDYRDAMRVLSDIGFVAADTADFQAAADRHVLKACQLVRAVTPAPLVTDCFMLRYDAHNLKVLFKSRHLAQKPQFLSECGTLPVEKLHHCVTDHTYTALPAELKSAMETLEKRTAAHFDPMLVDTAIDQAMYRQIFLNLSKDRSSTVAEKYFRAKVDLVNIVILLRLKAMGKDAAFFESVALPGGDVAPKLFSRLFAEGERLAKLMRHYGAQVYQAVLSAVADSQKLPFLEKTADDTLYALMRPYRYDTASLEVLISFLLQKQREATDVRLVMAGKLNSFTPDAVAERMRELNG
jgi:V/A-type H+/Na+-transporting ATPase subunit C